MIKIIIPILLFSFSFSDFLETFRVGFDVSKKFDLDFTPEAIPTNDFKGDMKKTLVLGYDNPYLGFEYIITTDVSKSADGWIFGHEKVSMFTLYAQHQRDLKNNITLFGRVGYNWLSYFDDNGAIKELGAAGIDVDFNITGGLAVGIGVNYKKFQFSCFLHNGSINAVFSSDDISEIADLSSDILITRMTVSYLF